MKLPAFSALIGSVYVPHEGSKYYEDDWDDKIIDDCIKLKAKYNMPFLLMGDFNARTGHLDDFVQFNDGSHTSVNFDFLDEDLGAKNDLDNFGICTGRYNEDAYVNNNGHKRGCSL